MFLKLFLKPSQAKPTKQIKWNLCTEFTYFVTFIHTHCKKTKFIMHSNMMTVPANKFLITFESKLIKIFFFIKILRIELRINKLLRWQRTSILNHINKFHTSYHFFQNLSWFLCFEISKHNSIKSCKAAVSSGQQGQ